MLSVTYKPLMLSVIMPSVIMLSAVMPTKTADCELTQLLILRNFIMLSVVLQNVVTPTFKHLREL